MTKILQTPAIVKVVDVPTAIGPLRLAFDADDGRWSPLAQVSMYCGAPCKALVCKAENRYWSARTLPGIGFCLPVPKLQEFLESIKPSSVFSPKVADFEWMRSHAARILRDYRVEVDPPRLIPEEEIPGPRGHEKANVPGSGSASIISGSGLRTFAFDYMPVRVVAGDDGEPRWVAKDVAEAVGATWSGQRIQHVPEEWRGMTSVVTPSGTQEMAVLTEQGLYFFLARSDKPAALPFQKWIAGEVLPAIRKTGAFSVETQKPMSSLEILVAQAQALLEQDRKLTALEGKIQTLETRQREAEEDLTALPEASSEVPDLSTRGMIGRLVRNHAIATGVFYQTVWNILYTEFRDRYHVDLKAHGPRGKKLKPLDAAEELGVVQQLYDLAAHLFGKVAA